MSLEDGSQKNIELTTAEKEHLDLVFSEEKIYGDAFNEIMEAFLILSLIHRGDKEAVQKYLQERKEGEYRPRHYLQRIQEKGGTPATREYIRSHSDPEMVRRFDEIVDIINNETEVVLETEDEKRAEEIANLYRNLREDVRKPKI